MATAGILLNTETRFGFAGLFRKWVGQKEPLPAQEVEDTRARLDFIREMMDTHPGAFATDEGFRCSTFCFAARF